LPFDYEEYGKEIVAYLDAAKKKTENDFGKQALDFREAIEAAQRFEQAGAKLLGRQQNPPAKPGKLNQALREAERALLLSDGLPDRPWFRHSIYAPGQYTGYAAVVIPGVNEAIDKRDVEQTRRQLTALAVALSRATKILEYH
jgi:N-acetylated-alpha-linked acidic dipeptidase